MHKFRHLKSPSKPLGTIRPLKATFSTTESNPDTLSTFRQAGLASIARGEVAAVLLGGGQGSRLGFDKAKALYDVGLPSGKTLLQLQAEQISKLRVLAAAANDLPLESVRLPWCIMTNDDSFEDIKRYIEERHFFGIPPEDFLLFRQGLFPAVDANTGAILMKAPGRMSMSPNGNGGVYESLSRSGVLRALKNRNVQALHIYNVDNLLSKVADPTAFGALFSSPSLQVLIKSISRLHEKEAVGTLASIDGKPGVIEYSEISHELASSRDENGELVMRNANLGSQFFRIDFIDRVLTRLHELPLHAARKSVTHCIASKTGGLETVRPQKGEFNAMKFELYILDALRFLEEKELAVLDVRREDEFAPVKNMDGEGARDTPTSARALYTAYHARLLRAAGAELEPVSQLQLEELGEGAPSLCVEISPRLTYSGEGLEFVQGMKLSRPVNLDL